MTEAAAASIVSHHADFASFNELCHDQFDDLITRLRAAGWPQDNANFARWAPALLAGQGACNGGEFGNAIFGRQPMGEADRIPLGDDGTTEHRNMLCDHLLSAPHMRFCSTHISYREVPGGRTDQLAAALSKMEQYDAAGDTVITAGDFNAQLDWGRMDAYYSSSVNTPANGRNTGHYHELDDNNPACPGVGIATDYGATGGAACGNPPKIDFIFVREDRIAPGTTYSAEVIGPGPCETSTTSGISCGARLPESLPKCGQAYCSDHSILIGRVTVLQ
ncbi:endonuclease/exonuclease/phosphatase family protein [Nocardia sp. NPDC101769]|uniref:endonuclease/exonuclease/phosphatase family protein n=1 Tax=Nocardia sp. NPDC101769 TaxID=3364333 RepID=UPI0037F416F8